MQRYLRILLIVAISLLIAGLYGIFHDQLTYTISEEYYTKFKFIQFAMDDLGLGVNIGTSETPEIILGNPRLGVALVGFLATWWMGFPIGLVLGLVVIRFHFEERFFLVFLRAIGIVLLVALATGLLGLLVGNMFFTESNMNWKLPSNLVNPKRFISVGFMHNFSYLGGLFGLIAALIFMRLIRRKEASKFHIT